MTNFSLSFTAHYIFQPLVTNIPLSRRSTFLASRNEWEHEVTVFVPGKIINIGTKPLLEEFCQIHLDYKFHLWHVSSLLWYSIKTSVEDYGHLNSFDFCHSKSSLVDSICLEVYLFLPDFLIYWNIRMLVVLIHHLDFKIACCNIPISLCLWSY